MKTKLTLRILSLRMLLLAISFYGFFLSINAFEGELHYRSVVNADKFMIAASRGKIYNGVRNQTVLVKGDRILLYDNTQYYKLYDRENDCVIFYSGLTKQGIKMSYSLYTNLSLSLSPKKRTLSIAGVTVEIAPLLYEKQKVENANMKWNDTELEYWKGSVEHKESRCDWELCYIDKAMPQSYFDAMLYGLEVGEKSLIYKFLIHTLMNLPDVTPGARKIMEKQFGLPYGKNPKAYECAYLTDFQERKIQDKEMSVPTDITITEITDLSKIDAFDFSHYQTVQSNGIKLEQKTVEYEIKDDWDF